MRTPAKLPAGSTEGKRPYFSRFLPNRPPTLKSFDTHTRWQPVTRSVDLDDLTQKQSSEYPGGGGVLSYITYTSMCRPKGS